MRRWNVCHSAIGVALVAAALLVAGCVNGPRVRGPTLAETDLPPLDPAHGRIFFYGKNIGLKGVPSVGLWHPNVTIDGTPVIVSDRGQEVVFYVDRSPGRYVIAVDNDVGERDRPPPPDYAGQSLEVEVAAGRAYYVRLIAHGSNAPLLPEPSQHYLELRRVPDVLGSVEIQRFEYLPVTRGG